jgi:hypothetical protein
MTDHTEPTDERFLDINAVAGELREVFAVDLTTATGQCAGCGRSGPLADGVLYGRSPGHVLRCRSCDNVLLRMVSGPGQTWLDLRGLAYVQVITS